MSHTVKIYLIADQEIRLLGKDINIHSLYSINVESDGTIVSYTTQPPIDKDNLKQRTLCELYSICRSTDMFPCFTCNKYEPS